MDASHFLKSAAEFISHHPLGAAAVCGLVGLKIAERWSRRFSPARGAEQIHRDTKALYSTEHEYVPVNPAEFRFADLAFYDRVERELETHGFRSLGDWEDVTLSRTYPKMRTFIRHMVSADGSSVA